MSPGDQMLMFLFLLFYPQVVVRHITYPTVDHAPRAYQPRDMTGASGGPYYVLIGQNKLFCAVSAKDYASVTDGERFDCHWQQPRN